LSFADFILFFTMI